MHNSMQCFDRQKALAQVATVNQRVGVQPDRLEQAGSVSDELETARTVANQDMLASIRSNEQGGDGANVAKRERVRRPSANGGYRQDMRAGFRAPEDPGGPGVLLGRVGKKLRPTASRNRER